MLLVTTYFNPKTAEGRLVLISLALFVVLIVVGAAIRAKKEELLPRFKIMATLFVLAYSLTVGIIYFVRNTREAVADGSYQPYQTFIAVTYIVIAIVCILLFFILKKDESDKDSRPLVFGAVFLALSFALSYVRLFKLPQGGSITLASVLPLAIYSYYFGVKRGVVACLSYGILQAIQDPWIIHPIQFMLDYPLAFVTLGFVGVFRGKFTRSDGKSNALAEFVTAFVIVVLVRYILHSVSGAVFFAEYGIAAGFDSAFLYGFTYNSFVLVDGAIALVLGIFLLRSKSMQGEFAKLAN